MVASGLCPQDHHFLISGEARPGLCFLSTQLHSCVWTESYLASNLLENPDVATPGCSCHSDRHLQKSVSLPLSKILKSCRGEFLPKVWGLGQFIPILLGLGCLVSKVDTQQDSMWYYQHTLYFLSPVSLPPSFSVLLVLFFLPIFCFQCTPK